MITKLIQNTLTNVRIAVIGKMKNAVLYIKFIPRSNIVIIFLFSIGRHSKSLDVQKKRCGYCYGKFELFINRTTKSGTVQMKTPSRSKDPSAFALYVKENYHSVKQNRRSMKHGDVMKVLGQQFSAIKIAKKQCDIIEEKEKSLSE